ncbi:CMGC family protein kinase [Trichomonas vaginalis G3]|uniref:non-specific serine/threonine protein kinase n=1 Tax=Trichomonas vaginalis (strain ATCC PRA-98 / G3) TaxID=412133 RepID=A2DZU4_TRIV3|nr:STKc GSK3 domain-containing protein [Trichomonas vaginalis G3]EAY14003.1 CMGC family protein kinase [Trichomonas vaginalis G3]KAI5519563.1 STKc GSK3 domain-containing protein [Trichomonas vaginalis G3]|eukprot:XP_001326226.1 CMGC family protein kinase [Trichomonas vaginalis G3]
MERLKPAGRALDENLGYQTLCVSGIGTFGAVFKVQDDKGEVYAIKKVWLNPRFKNRESQITPLLAHPNCLHCYKSFITNEGPNRDAYFHLVTDFLPEDLEKLASVKSPIDMRFVKIFGYQLFAGLCYLHHFGLCHRDIKPSNVLIDQNDGRCQLCDFGSAKFLVENVKNVSYIATRSYRAPELILDCKTYNTKIDVWSAGCVLAELVLHTILFNGTKGEEVLERITGIIGMPKIGDLDTFQHNLPLIFIGPRYTKLQNEFPPDTDPEFLDLLNHIFVWNVNNRYSAADCMRHPFFKDVWNLKLPNGNDLPEYFHKMKTPEEMFENFPDGPHE